MAFFERELAGGANTVSKDDWYDIGALSTVPQDSPIPTGKRLWLGFAFLYSADKSMEFELRSNKAGQTTGTVANTDLVARGASDPGAGSNAIDLYQGGAIQVDTIVGSASNEKLWLRVTSGTNTVAAFSWLIFYTYDA